MKTCLALVFTFFALSISAQDLDYGLFEDAIKNSQKEDTRETHIEVHQFLDNCIYDQKCGVFLKESTKKTGLIKGFFLSIDRRLRCSSLTRSQALPVRFDSKGYIKDHAEDYSSKGN